MSNFRFKIEKVSHLLGSKNTLVYGEILEGKIMMGASVQLRNNEAINEIVIKGIILGDSRPKVSKHVSLIIDSVKHKNIINLMKEGDFLLGN